MRVPWQRWVGLVVFVTVLVTAFVQLGFWQMHRLNERKENNAVVIAHENAPVRPAAEVMQTTITDADQWQRVTLTGTFDAAGQLVVLYRNRADSPGAEVVTPLRADDGRVYLVDRGFLRRAKGAGISADAPPPPTGTVTVVGYVRRDEVGPDSATVPRDGTIRLISSSKIAEATGQPLVNGYVGAISVDGQSEELLPMLTPTLDEGPHFWYAVQWFMFIGFAVVGLVWFVGKDIRRLRAKPGPDSVENEEPGDEKSGDGSRAD